MKTILFVLSICFNVVFSQKLKSLLLTDNRKLTYYENVERKEISIEYKIGGLINIAATITDGLDKEIQNCDPINEETLNIRQIYTLRQEQARFAGILAELGQIFSTPLPSYSDSDNNTNVIKLESLFSNHSMVIAALTNDITQVQNYSLSDYKDDKENHHRFVVYGLNFIQGIYTEGGIAAARLLETIRQSLSYGSNIDLFPLLVEYNFIDLPSNSAAEEFSPQHCGSGTGNGTIICKYSYYQLSEPETLISLTPIAYNGVSLKEDTFS